MSDCWYNSFPLSLHWFWCRQTSKLLKYKRLSMFSLVCTGRKMWSCPLLCYWTWDFHKTYTRAVFSQGNQSSNELHTLDTPKCLRSGLTQQNDVFKKVSSSQVFQSPQATALQYFNPETTQNPQRGLDATNNPVRPKLNSEYLKRSQLLYQKIELTLQPGVSGGVKAEISLSDSRDVPLLFCVCLSLAVAGQHTAPSLSLRRNFLMAFLGLPHPQLYKTLCNLVFEYDLDGGDEFYCGPLPEIDA